MNKFAELLDRLAYEPGRNAKLRLIADYLRTTADPERGCALAALTGALTFRHAKAGMIRALIMERADPALFALSYDYVGDLSETVALMWPAQHAERVPLPPRSGGEGLGVGGSSLNSSIVPPTPDPSPPLASLAEGGEQKAPTLTDVVETLGTLGKAQLPGQIARWLDGLDETGRWALLKLVTGALRIGVSARLAKTAAASLGDKAPDEVELLWPGLAPPYTELFAWLEGRGEKPATRDPAPFRPPMLAHAIEDSDLATLDAADFMAEWKWDGIRVQAVAGLDEEIGRAHV